MCINPTIGLTFLSTRLRAPSHGSALSKPFFSFLEELPVALLPIVMVLRFVFPINISDFQLLGDNYADLIHWFL